MQKVIHRSWVELREEEAPPSQSLVALDFEGQFTSGSYEGERFAGRICYDRDAPPTDRHASFAIYEDWPAPIVTMAIGGQVLTGDGAAVYDSVFNGHDRHYDFVNMFGTCAFHGVEDAAFFELLFADEDASALDGTRMPSARTLCNLPVKQISFGTNAPGNAISIGAFVLSAAG